ncbi:MAG: hypothetical protein HKO65_15230 [Gemmatimonadetes bacterium]|nr:hypothetical protein [Gemmatimonadota bacterium]NNM06444.1 hypothetical protein [Gemmatimonadota bacterium]
MKKKAMHSDMTGKEIRAPRSPALVASVVVALLPLLGTVVACDDDLFQVNWEENPDTAFLFSLARPELNLLSGFDFIGRNPIPIESPEATGKWDMVLDTHEGGLVLLPPSALGIFGDKARIIPMGDVEFDAVRRAPADTTQYIGDQPVPVELGHVYIVRTRQQAGFYGRQCVYYGKFEPLEQDPVAGTLSFMFDVSPVCNSRKLYPPK